VGGLRGEVPTTTFPLLFSLDTILGVRGTAEVRATMRIGAQVQIWVGPVTGESCSLILESIGAVPQKERSGGGSRWEILKYTKNTGKN